MKDAQLHTGPVWGLLLGLGLGLFFWTGCSREPEREEDGFRIRVQLDWRPEPQHGGLYQALVDGYFEAEGLDVELVPGGTNVLVTQKVATGEAEIGQSASSQIIQFRSNGFPLKNLASVFHWAPSALLLHEENPVEDFTDLNGKRIMARPEAVYIPYLKDRYGIDFEVVPQSFGLGGFLSDPGFIQEGFFIAEPFFLEAKGAKVKWLALKDAGYSPYAVLFSTDRFLEEHPEEVRAFLRAYLRGWETYLGDGYPRAHEAMKKDNDSLTDDFLAFGRGQIVENRLVRGDRESGERIGSIDPDRIAREIEIMESIGLLKPGEVTEESVLARGYPTIEEASDPKPEGTSR